VQTLLKTADLTGTRRFVPAAGRAASPLEAVILLRRTFGRRSISRRLWQREVRDQAETAVATGQLGPLEDFYIDVLTWGNASIGSSCPSCSARRPALYGGPSLPISPAWRRSICLLFTRLR